MDRIARMFLEARRGGPLVSLSGVTREALTGRRLLVSITHSQHYAAACAVLVEGGAGEDAP